MCWGLKFLAGQPQAQTKLRIALEGAFPSAIAAGRDLTIQEITGMNIPYLDATIEETLRCAGTALVVKRKDKKRDVSGNELWTGRECCIYL